MPADTLMLDCLLRTAGGGLLFLLAACIAIGLRRQPADRVRAGELALIGSLLIPCVALLPGLAPWSLGLLQTTSALSPPSIPVETIAIAPASVETREAAESIASTDAVFAGSVKLRADQHSPANAAGPTPNARRHSEAGPTIQAPVRPVFQGASAPPITWQTVVLTAYACATALVLCWTLLGLGKLFLLRRTARPAPPEAAALLAEIAGPGCKRVRLMMSERIGAPVVFGGFRPIILLPASFCTSGDQAALRFCLAHEWSHVERGDLWRWNLIAFAQLVFFYQPLFWWLRRQIRLSQDFLADARAAHQSDSVDYAEFLVGLARRQMTAPALALSIADHSSHLAKRVHMLLLNRQPLARRCRAVWTAGAWFTACALLCLAASIRFAAADPAPGPTSALPASDDKKDAPAPQAEAKNQAGPLAGRKQVDEAIAHYRKALEIKPDAGPLAGREQVDEAIAHYRKALEIKPDYEKVEVSALSGQVVDKATGKPISGATVTISHSPERLMSSLATRTKCQTDAEGNYSGSSG